MKQLNETKKESASSFSVENLRGILLPFTTPFNKSGDVDGQGLRSNILKWNETGIRGYVALGSTGERVHLSETERAALIETARECVPKNLVFIVGAGQQSVRGTFGEIRRAAELGADAVLVITPHFYRGAMTQGALFKYYWAVADEARVPVVLYSMPELTGVTIAPETVARLSEHENIAGIKDSSGDVINLAETLRLVPEDFAVMTGNGASFYAALAEGVRGAILAVGCVATRETLAIFGAVQRGEHERGRRLQERLTPLALAVTRRYGIGGLKAALDMIGYAGGHVRAPLEDASENARREISGLLEEAALPVDENIADETSTDDATLKDEARARVVDYRLAGATKE
ncbi:MAG: dihydrodipicolinate synthase family protein [Pyrinomonadaceae bacterium]